ncbi:hypothetical protein C8Q77DRAFT_1063530 [Trametes polyzona]|nr:hypothetical protein C8Q77DRAFT_1063530 [Trametes polyzona]
MPHKRAKRSVREKRRAESGADLVPGVRRALEDEDIPKSAARVLNAAKIQQEWAERKRKLQGQGEDGAGPSRKKRKSGGGGGGSGGDGQGEGGKTALRIQPGESIAHFNRRVEDSMRHSVREAMQISSAKMRRARKEEEEQLAQKSGSGKAKPAPKARSNGNGRASRARRPATATAKGNAADEPKDFERVSTSAPRRLNDVVQAPPQIKKLPRKAKKLQAAQGGAAQKGEGAKSLREGIMSMAQKAMMEEERDRVIRLYREMKKGKAAT